MPLRRTMALLGAGLNVCLLSGCIFTAAGKSDLSPPPEHYVGWEKPSPDEPKAVDVTAPAVRDVVRPEAPPEPKPEPPPQSVEPPPPAPPAPPAPPPDPPAIAALRAYLDQKPDSEAARKVLQRLRETDRTILDALLPIVKDACTDGLDVEQVLKALDLLEERLRPHRPLTLNKVCFTRGIEGFGVYEPLPAGEVPVFQSGLDGRPGERVQVYVEVRNFASRQVGACWETALASTLEVWDIGLNKQLVATLKRPARVDRSLSPRQDYSLNIQFHIPPKLPPGNYKLRVIVSDEVVSAGDGPRVNPHGLPTANERTLEFRVDPPR